jgi:hypothetical protein
MAGSDDHNADARDGDATDLDWLAACYVWGEMDALQRAAFERRLADDTAACEAVARAVELSDCLAAACAPVATPRTASHERSTSREAAAGSPVRLRRRRTWSQRIIWMSVGAAACLAVVSAGQSWLARHGGAPIYKNDIAQRDAALREIAQHDSASHNSADSEVVQSEVVQVAPPEDDDSSSLALAWTESAGSGADFWQDSAVLEEPVADAHRLPALSAPSYGVARIEEDSQMDTELATPDWLLAAVASVANGGDSSDSRPPDGPASDGPASDGSVPN